MKKEITIQQPESKKIRIKETLNSNFAGMTFILNEETSTRYFVSPKLSFLKTDCEVV
jgi:hypothetical protein